MSVQDQITAAANAAGVPAQFALNIAQRESGFNQAAVGTSGEIGIFQLLPSTAASLGVNPSDATQNIAGGVAYLAQLLGTYGGDEQKAAAAYNWGPTNLNGVLSLFGPADTVTANGVTMPAWLAAIPASVQAYVAAVAGSLSVAASPGGSTPTTAAAPGSTAAAVLPSGQPQPAPALSLATLAWGGLALFAFLILTPQD
jgi:soluble lytic murein transglycosylase-like protein